MEGPTFGELVRRYRKLRGLTQEQLAERAGTDKGYVSKLEDPSKEIVPGHDMAQRIIEALQASQDADRFLRALGYPTHTSDPRADLIIAGRSIEGLTEDDLRIVEQVAERLRVKVGPNKS